MKTEIPITPTFSATLSATVIDGQLQLDEPLSLPNQSRVHVRVEASNLQAQLAWEAIKEQLKRHPIHAAGAHFTREELNDRD